MDYKGYVISKIVKFVCIALVLILLAAGIAFTVSLFAMKPAYSKVNLKFASGGIGADGTGTNGVVYEDGSAMYSTNAVKCTGFILSANFDTRVDYEIHYYTDDDKYIGYVSSCEQQYSVDAGDMPVLRDNSGSELTEENIAAGAPVKDADGNEIPAAYIRIVVRPMGADDNYFDGLSGWLLRGRYDRAIKLSVTQAKGK